MKIPLWWAALAAACAIPAQAAEIPLGAAQAQARGVRTQVLAGAKDSAGTLRLPGRIMLNRPGF